jgi:hypothetical protein
MWQVFAVNNPSTKLFVHFVELASNTNGLRTFEAELLSIQALIVW